MKVITSLDNLNIVRACVGIGVFDGFHRGHQQVMLSASEAAKAIDGTCVALTFDRHPADLVMPAKAPYYLTTLSQKIEAIAESGVVDILIVVPFDHDFSNMTPAHFVSDVLTGKLGAKEVRVGGDFRYGKDRAGSVMDLEAAGATHGYNLEIVHPITDEGERVSSTHIRGLVAEGNVAQAGRLLGRPFTLRGTVVHGKKLGRTIGFPTANLELSHPRQIKPAPGVYAGWAITRASGPHLDSRPPFYDASLQAERYPAAISVGTNPTTDGINDVVKVEAYLLGGFGGDLYDQPLDLAFVEHIRAEARFDSLDALVKKIGEDVEAVKDALSVN